MTEIEGNAWCSDPKEWYIVIYKYGSYKYYLAAGSEQRFSSMFSHLFVWLVI